MGRGGQADRRRPSSVHVFRLIGGGWIEEAELVAGDASQGARFGSAIALDGARLAVGAAEASETGAVYLFERSGTSWSQVVKLVPSDAEAGDSFGRSLDLDRNTLVVGADVRAYVFELHDPGAPSFCDGTDNALAFCPCANSGTTRSGCDLPQGTGGVSLAIVAQRISPANRVTATGTGFPAGTTPAAIVLRSNGLDPAGPIAFGDGLRCIGVPLVRLSAAFAIDGTSTHAFGHAGSSGDWFYQLWFRSLPAMFCTPEAFNLSNGRVLDW